MGTATGFSIVSRAMSPTVSCLAVRSARTKASNSRSRMRSFTAANNVEEARAFYSDVKGRLVLVALDIEA